MTAFSGKVVSVGDTWKLSDNAAQAACLFHGVLKNGLTGKLTGVKDGVATFTVEGPADGIENGAKVTLAVSAVGTFDIASGRVSSLTWKQKDTRESGAVNPASEVEVEGATVGEVLKALDAAHPGFADRILDDEGGLRRFVNVFVADDDVRYLDGLATPVPDGETVSIIPAVAGG